MIDFFQMKSRILLLLTFILLMQNRNVTSDLKLTSIFSGDGGKAMYEVDTFSSWTGKRPTIIVHFTNWCPYTMDILFNLELMNMWTNKTIPLVTWELFPCGSQKLPGITKLIHNGTYDTYINEFGDRLKTWLSGNDGFYGNEDDRRLYLRLAHEMNGNWYPWSQNATPTDYILAWQHIHNILSNKSLDSTRLQWIWCVNNFDAGGHKAEEYWVGDNYVDWIGIDGYNFGESLSWNKWLWPHQLFDIIINRLRQLSSTKPIAFPEYGTASFYTSAIPNIQYKTEWLNQFCSYINDKQIKFASYFNIERSYEDWAIFNGTCGDTIWNNINVYTAYRDCLQSDDCIQPNSTNPRLITDDQFAGRF